MRKGKVYPSSSPSSPYKDPDSVLKLLPGTILALASSLPRHDLEVLAYLIARSIFPATHLHLKATKGALPINKHTKWFQTVPIFECGCFDCYTSFWYRWDSSPNRELIHHAIEAFEDHLVQNESPKKHASRGKRNGNNHKLMNVGAPQQISGLSSTKPQNVPDILVASETKMDIMNTEGGDMEDNVAVRGGEEEVTGNLEMEIVTVQQLATTGGGGNTGHRGLTRKVLPDVVGLFNSRLWSNLWSPGI